jgi:type I restriction enzyme S subunit
MSAAWPRIPLGEVLRLSLNPEDVSPEQSYPTFGVYGFGRGLFDKPPVVGAGISATKLFRARAGQFIYSRLKAFEGAFGLIPSQFDGRCVTNEFPTFDCVPDRLDPNYLDLYFRRPAAWAEAAQLSTGIGARRERLHPEQFLSLAIPLPPLAEQRRIVERVEAIAARIAEARRLQAESDHEISRLLTAVYQRMTSDAPRKPMRDVAPLSRRPVAVEATRSYPQVSARSFGKGTFHQPTLHGADITWEKPFQVKAGDLLISNIKAWEGAIAVVSPEDNDRYCSHRYLTCLPTPGVATARFVCFHLLTPEGLYHVGEASPGSADRNRTTNSKQLMEIPIPVPSFESQLRFDALQAKADALRALQSETAAELDALLPSVLNKAFAGEL